MKAVTIWQPWASPIMIGAKPYEFRPKSYLRYVGAPAIGERVVIHAGMRPVRRSEIEDLLVRLGTEEDTTGLTSGARPLLVRVLEAHKCRLLPLGCGLGTAVLGRPRNAGELFGGQIADSDRQAADSGAFNWAWPMNSIERFEAPIPQRGAQGFWQWPVSLEA
jgi:hypothetical protein